MFTEMLDRVLTGTPGAMAVTLMGFDGIEIASSVRERAEAHQVAVLELGNLAGELRRIAESLGTGEMEEFSVRMGELTTLLRPLTEDYFLALSLGPNGNAGKGRYLLRIVGAQLREEL